MSWLSGGDDDDLFTKAEGNALEPPDLAVKREIFRLELEAEVANLQAENEAIMSEAVVEGRVVEVPPGLAEAAGAAGIEVSSTALAADETGATTTPGTAPALADDAATADAAAADAEPAAAPAADDDAPPG